MKYKKAFYKTRDGLLKLKFLFVDFGYMQGWRIYVLSDIDYKCFSTTRSDSNVITHLFTDKQLLNYPCISWYPPVYSLDDAYKIAQIWAETTAYYIRYGGDYSIIFRTLTERGVI